MCKTSSKLEDTPPMAIRADSTISNADSNCDYEDWSDSTPRSRPAMIKSLSSWDESDEISPSSTRSYIYHLISWVLAGTAASVATNGFAYWFPHFLAPVAAKKTYDFAVYNYDPRISHFDNTAWTYGTDYALALVMGFVVYSIMRYYRPGVSDRLCLYSASLLLGYCVSVTAGGYCHQFYTSVESRNSISFRILWTICVGTVSFASASMGISGTEVVRQFQQQQKCSPYLKSLPVIPEPFWIAFGVFTTIVTAMGGMSFQRPACDIFVAGITQFPPTFYLMVFFALVQHPKVPYSARIIGIVGFILNAPLLPMYPLLIQYTDLSLASVNTLLHSWLCVAWSMQGYSLKLMIRALVAEREEIDAKTQVQKSQ